MFHHFFKKTGRKVATLSVLTFALNAWADEIPSDWKSMRALGMGNAFTGVSNDETAPFFNPAGVARTHNPRSKSKIQFLTFPGLTLGGNEAGVKALRQPGPALSRFSNLFDYAMENPNTPVYFEAQAYPAMIYGGKKSATILVGFPMRSTTKIMVPDAENPLSAYVRSSTTASAVFGTGVTSRAGRVSAGVSVRPNMRYGLLYDNFNPSDVSISSFKSEIMGKAAKTYAVPIDVGVLFVAADYWLPSLGIAVRNLPTGCAKEYINPVTGEKINVCGSKRFGSLSEDAEANMDNVLDPTEARVGVSITPRGKISGTAVNFRLAADVYPIPITTGGVSYGLGDLYINKLVHVGAEFSFGNPNYGSSFALRAGLNQGFLTYGGTINMFGVEFEYASYMEDIGERLEQKADRRHLVGVTTTF